MTSDIAEKKVSIALRTLWSCVVAMVIATATAVVGAVRLQMTISSLQNDHWGYAAQTRWASYLANWNHEMAVPDPIDISGQRGTVAPIKPYKKADTK